ncbi:MAG: addiction module protein [Pseudomonadales bacterium]|nr:addiction module protein [Pseudomonadales bacterium]MCP5337010.1 addiction module protein [Pseudomonadales bacterium]
MAAILKDIEAKALELSPKERGSLIHSLIMSLDGPTEETPEEIAKAWDEEIARRIADIESGRMQCVPADEVFNELDAIIREYDK